MWTDIALLLLRLALGAIFLYHGISKIRTKHQKAFMMFLGYAETLGGLAVIIGLLSRYASIGFMIVMLSAMYMKLFKWKTPFSTMQGSGWEFDLLICISSFVLAIMGAGIISLDKLIGM